MTVSAINGSLLTTLSAIDGVALASISEINGIAKASGGGAAIPVFHATTVLSFGSGALSRAWPSGHQADDIGILVCQSVGAETISLSTPAGFVEVTNSPQATGTGLLGTRIAVFWCRATSGAMGAPTIADPGDHILAVMLTFRGCVTSGDPINTTAGNVKAAASTTLTYESVTTTENNCLIVMCGTRDLDSGAAWSGLPVNANLSDIAERFDDGNAVNAGGGIAVYDGGKASAGSTGTSPATITSSINAYLTLALRGA